MFDKKNTSILGCFLITFTSSCSTSTYETSDVLLNEPVGRANLTSSLKSSSMIPSIKLVPKSFVVKKENSADSSGYLGSNLISENDLLEIEVYRNPDLTKKVRVDNNGNITFPLISKIHAKGLSAPQLAEKIKQALEKDFIVEAHVNVLVKESSKNYFSIEGSVKKSGVFPVSGKTTFLQAIAYANGLSEDADKHHATLLREGKNGQVVQQAIDIAAISKGKQQDFLLKQGDRIVVQKSIYNRFTVNGAVIKPGIFPLTEGITFLQAITLAGGINTLAHKNKAILFRYDMKNNIFKKYKVNLTSIKQGRTADPFLKPDDRIVIVESKQKVLFENAIRLISPISTIKNLLN